MDAVDDLSDAIDVTRNLLVPVRPWLWLKLAIVVFFLGSMTLGGGFQGDPSMFAQDPTFEEQPAVEDQPAVEEEVQDVPDEVMQNLLLAAIVIGVALLVLWLLFRFVGAIMEFVFVESLRSDEVHVRRYFKQNVGRGIRLFGFRLLVFLLAIGLVGVPLVLILLGTSSFEAMAGSLLLLVPFGIFVSLIQAIVMRFTSEFVAPIMLLEDRGVIGGWKRFWGTVTANWSEYLVYLLLVWILQLVIGFGFLFLFAIVGIIIAIPTFILVFLLLTLGEIGVLLAILVGVLALLAFILAVALIEMPVRTYFQYYALLLLGDTNDALDLVPEQRELVRDGGRRDDTAADRDDSSDDAPVWDEDDDTDSWNDGDDWGDSSRDDVTDGDRDGPDGDECDDPDDDRSW